MPKRINRFACMPTLRKTLKKNHIIEYTKKLFEQLLIVTQNKPSEIVLKPPNVFNFRKFIYN